jgi:hypothetical protein
MSMQCRRCPAKIQAGQIAHIARNVIVCANCLEDGERGYLGRLLPTDPTAETAADDWLPLPRITRRQQEVLALVADGKVTRASQRVWADENGQRGDVKNTINTLRGVGLCVWEQLEPETYGKGLPSAIARPTELGLRLLAAEAIVVT